jgi:hypothetical protein
MSTLRVNTLQDVAGTGQPAMVGAAKAWVNFDGTGTVAIRAQFNVTSITDNGTGDYTVNFTTAIADTNYVAVFGNENGTSAANASPKLGLAAGSTPQTGSIRITNDRDSATGFFDNAFCFVAIFR